MKFSPCSFLTNLISALKYTWYSWKSLDITSSAKNTEALIHLFHPTIFSFHFSDSFDCFNQVFKWSTPSAGKKDTSDNLETRHWGEVQATVLGMAPNYYCGAFLDLHWFKPHLNSKQTGKKADDSELFLQNYGIPTRARMWCSSRKFRIIYTARCFVVQRKGWGEKMQPWFQT